MAGKSIDFPHSIPNTLENAGRGSRCSLPVKLKLNTVNCTVGVRKNKYDA